MSGWASVTFVYCVETAKNTAVVAVEYPLTTGSLISTPRRGLAVPPKPTFPFLFYLQTALIESSKMKYKTNLHSKQ